MTKLMSPLEQYRHDKGEEIRRENEELLEKERKEAAYVAHHSAKRLLQTSPPYPSAIEALDACQANRQLPGCDYAYVTEDHRVVGFYEYYDVTPEEPVKRGQRRVTVPANF